MSVSVQVKIVDEQRHVVATNMEYGAMFDDDSSVGDFKDKISRAAYQVIRGCEAPRLILCLALAASLANSTAEADLIPDNDTTGRAERDFLEAAERVIKEWEESDKKYQAE